MNSELQSSVQQVLTMRRVAPWKFAGWYRDVPSSRELIPDGQRVLGKLSWMPVYAGMTPIE